MTVTKTNTCCLNNCADCQVEKCKNKPRKVSRSTEVGLTLVALETLLENKQNLTFCF